jgi:general secretion pathway protein A
VYNTFYKLKETPFRLTPDAAFLYMTAQHREALSGLVYSACNRAGLTVLLGEAGTGKTTLLHVLKGWLEERRFVTALLTNPTLTREEFFDLLCFQLGVNCDSPLKSRQLMAVQETLTKNYADGRRAVLIVDEAQRLPAELLEEIRLLLNLETPHEKLLEIIIAGQPELLHVLRCPELRQLKQRVSCYCRLKPLSLDEVREYIQHRLAKAGLPDQSLFPHATMALIHQLTGGIPRLVSSLCAGALQTGFALQSAQITIPILQEVARDLDLLPQDEPDKVLPSNGDGRMAAVARKAVATAAVAFAAPPPAVTIPALTQSLSGKSENTAAQATIPMENYASRQKSLGFLAGLMGRWR